MNPELEQAEAKAESKAESKAPKRRAGVPVWRTGKPDAVLAAAVDVARPPSKASQRPPKSATTLPPALRVTVW